MMHSVLKRNKMLDVLVYFGGAIRGDRVVAREMRELIRFIQSLGVPVLTEHIASDDPIETFAGKIGKSKEALTAEDIELQDITWLDSATHVIAEISGASTETGREIEYARTKHVFNKVPCKVLCLYREDREWYASPMIRGMTPDRYPNVSVRSYTNIDEAKKLAAIFLLG